MNDAFKNRAWGLYNEMLKTSDRPLIGDFGDVAKYLDQNGRNGWSRLALPMPPSPGFHWNTFVNDAWMQAFIEETPSCTSPVIRRPRIEPAPSSAGRCSGARWTSSRRRGTS